MVNSQAKPDVKQAFEKTLAAGVKSLPQQVRYVLALSQMNNAQSTTTPDIESPLTVTEAQLWSLVKLVDNLSTKEKQNLYKRVKALGEEDVRLLLTLELLPKLSSYISTTTLSQLWNEAQSQANPVIRSQIMRRIASLLTDSQADDQPISKPLSSVLQATRGLQNGEARTRALIALVPHLPSGIKNHIFNAILDEIDATSSDTVRANTFNALSRHLPPELLSRAFAIMQTIQKPAERARALTAFLPMADYRLEALNAIEQIQNEEDRSTALIALIPHLEKAKQGEAFPETLQKALTVSISFTRRLNRARTLVMLAPHLTPDLHGEALAAINNLSSEQDRAMLLGELAPHLPKNMLVASLVVAHTMREQDARVHALTILTRHAPEQARSQTQLDALAAATNLPNHFERVTALVNLADALPAELLDQTFANALEAARLIENDNARARALCLLGHHLPENLLIRAMQEAHQLGDMQQRINALTNIIPRLPESERQSAINQTLDYIAELPVSYKQARALISLAPHLTEYDITKTLTIVEAIHDPFDQVTAYIAVMPRMTETQQTAIQRKLWDKIPHIDEGYDRASALAALAPLIPAAPALAQRAEEIILSITDEYDCASAIAILAALLAHGETIASPVTLTQEMVITQGIVTAVTIPQQSRRQVELAAWVPQWITLEEITCYALWQQVARELIQLPLADTLLCLGVLEAVFYTLGGEQAVKDIAHILGLR